MLRTTEFALVQNWDINLTIDRHLVWRENPAVPLRCPHVVAAVFVALLSLPDSPAHAQTTADSNFRHCLDGWADCQLYRLTASQLEQVKQAELRRNYRHCLDGWADCRESLLTAEQKEAVTRAAYSRNYRHCVDGWADCRESLLTAEQKEVVTRAAYARNYRHCVDGWADCRDSKLTAEEQDVVVRAAHARNYRHCLDGWADCQTRTLSPSEQAKVAEAAYRRNMRHCLDGWADCRTSELTPDEQRQVVEADRRRNYQHCLSGWASCNRLSLTTEQAARVSESDYRRNADHCAKGWADCDRSKLIRPSPGSQLANASEAADAAQKPQTNTASHDVSFGKPVSETPKQNVPATAPQSSDGDGARTFITAQSPRQTGSQPPIDARRGTASDAPRSLGASPRNGSSPADARHQPPVVAIPSVPSNESTNSGWLVLLIAAAIAAFLWFQQRSPRNAHSEPAWSERTPQADHNGSDPRVEGGGADIIGNCDPVDGMPLREGEEVYRCTRCSTGYHLDSWAFLTAQNAGRCVSCASSSVSRIRLTAVVLNQELIVTCASCEARNRVGGDRPRARYRCGACHARLFPDFADSFATDIVRLEVVRERVGQIVLFRGRVEEVYRARSGTYLLKFERGRTRRVFKAVVMQNYIANFANAGVSLRAYEHQFIEVRGLVQQHPTWGHEIIVTDPSAITVLPANENRVA